MKTESTKTVPYSVRKSLVLRARAMADYVQGTMGLEGQGVPASVHREMIRRSYKEMIASRLSTIQ